MKTIKNFLTYWAYFIFYYVNIKIDMILYKNDKDLALINKTRMFALLNHHKVNQRYDKRFPYYYHLNMVSKFALKFLSVTGMNINCVIAALLHDTIEDIHFFTYNDIKKIFGTEVADIVFACSELRGKNRAERHGPEYYSLLQLIEEGAYVKICDVIANMTMGKMTGNSMLGKYRKEYPKFKSLLFKDKFAPLFAYIEANLLTD